jgi:hypothetical protein
MKAILKPTRSALNWLLVPKNVSVKTMPQPIRASGGGRDTMPWP